MTPRSHKTIRALGASTLFAAAALAAPAAQAAHSLTAAANGCYVAPGLGQYCDSHSTTSQVGEAGAEADFGGAQRAAVVVGYGEFHGSAQAALSTASTIGNGETARATASGIVQDTWVIGGGTGLAYLRLGFSVTGATASSGSGPNYASQAYLNIDVLSNAHTPGGSLVSGQANSDNITGNTFAVLSGSIPFYFGQALDLTFLTNVVASTGYGADYFGRTFSGSAQAGFSDTSLLTSIQAVDAQGRVIQGISIAAESGAAFPLAPEVPEPASAALMGLGVAVIAVRKLRRRGD